MSETIKTLLQPIQSRRIVAAAPADVARLLAAVQAVVALHRHELTEYREDLTCAGCGHYWPCPTVAAIESALTKAR